MTGHLVVPVEGGVRMRVDMSDVVGSVLAMSEVWEPHVVAAMRSELARGDVFVDVGAHVGYHTLVAARLVGTTGHVYALEPSPATYADLRVNIELNALSNVTALDVAAGAFEGHATLDDVGHDTTGKTAVRRARPAGAGAEESPGIVQLRPLASVLEPSHVARLRLVKIDVEGFEAEVLRGLEPLFDEGTRPSIILELHPGGGVRDAVPVLEHLVERYGLTAFELVRNSHHDRYASIPPPRPILGAVEMLALCELRTSNVLLTAGRGGRPLPSSLRPA
jgi:FkbM family methyltransferase